MKKKKNPKLLTWKKAIRLRDTCYALIPKDWEEFEDEELEALVNQYWFNWLKLREVDTILEEMKNAN